MSFIGPDIFSDVCRSFVQVQFRTRYCGHTLSRLADFCHNMTKQSGLPTVRRREPEKGDLSMACVLRFGVSTLGFEQKEVKAAYCKEICREFEGI
jgi:hypothetical protein